MRLLELLALGGCCPDPGEVAAAETAVFQEMDDDAVLLEPRKSILPGDDWLRRPAIGRVRLRIGRIHVYSDNTAGRVGSRLARVIPSAVAPSCETARDAVGAVGGVECIVPAIPPAAAAADVIFVVAVAVGDVEEAHAINPPLSCDR